MTPSRKFNRIAESYRRKGPAEQPTGRSFLIVTEGAKTEPIYLKGLRDHLHLAAADVIIVHPEGTDPKTLVREAIARRDQRKREAKNGPVIEYDEVWVVFDLEKPHDERRRLAVEAKNIEGATGIRFAISDPCFEFWLLLHEEYTTHQFQDCPEVEKRLKKHFPDYTKGMENPELFLKNTPVAVTNAGRCRNHHKTSGGNGNPSTAMDLLVKNINSATRPHYRFQL